MTSEKGVRSQDSPRCLSTCVALRPLPPFNLTLVSIADHALLVSRTLTRSQGARSDSHGMGPPGSLGSSPNALPARYLHTSPCDLAGPLAQDTVGFPASRV